MKTVIVTTGSRGDVAPYTGLGARLQAEGHEVAVAAQDAFASMIRDVGLEFRSMPGDLRTDLLTDEGRQWQDSGATKVKQSLRMAKKMMAEVGQGVVEVANGADVLLLQHGAALHGYLVAKSMGIPSIGLDLFPGVPTGDFMLPSLGTRSFGRWGNRVLPRLLVSTPTPFDTLLKQYCADLGLPPAGFGALRKEMLLRTPWPIMNGYSPILVPQPADWRPGVEVVGYWWPQRPHGWQPPTELVDFLKAGPPPVFIGFGSMLPGDGERLSSIASAAIKQAGVRAVVQAGWAGLEVTSDDVVMVGTVPHDWLFPQMSLVVHHGGAGTTGAALRAGVPAVTVPVVADQPFWGKRLVAAGVSPGSLRAKDLSAERLAVLIQAGLAEPGYAQRSQRIAHQMSTEDGAGRVLAKIDQLADMNEHHGGS